MAPKISLIYIGIVIGTFEVLVIISLNWMISYFLLMKAGVYEIRERLPYSAIIAGFLNIMFMCLGITYQWLVTLDVWPDSSHNPTHYAIFICSVMILNIPSSLVVLGRTFQIVFVCYIMLL